MRKNVKQNNPFHFETILRLESVFIARVKPIAGGGFPFYIVRGWRHSCVNLRFRKKAYSVRPLNKRTNEHGIFDYREKCWYICLLFLFHLILICTIAIHLGASEYSVHFDYEVSGIFVLYCRDRTVASRASNWTGY